MANNKCCRCFSERIKLLAIEPVLAAHRKPVRIVRKALDAAVDRLVIPRELEDILGISTSERRRWLADGRLPSTDTRTLRLRGRGEGYAHAFDKSAAVRAALDRVHARNDASIKGVKEVAFFPPMTGG